MSDFTKLADEILDYGWRTNPVGATFVGIHTYDRELGEFTPEFFAEQARQSREFVRKLDAFDRKLLQPGEAIDWRLLRDSCEQNARATEEIRFWEKDPAGPIGLGLYGVFVLALRDFAPLEQRAEAMLSRLKQVPGIIEQGRAVVKNSPEVFTRTALGVVQGGLSFYRGFLPAIADQVPALKADLLDASRKAVEAVENYQTFLKDDYLPRSNGSYAIGRELFDFLLRVGHGLPYNADDLVEIANRILAETESAMVKLAREIDPARQWPEIIAALKLDHPAPAELLDAYRKEMARARDFTREHGLVSIPDGETLELIWTPPFDRGTIPYAAYMAPAPFEADQKGFFYVTPVDDQLPPEKQEEQLQGHSRFKIPVTALHEAYPGHHLQLVWSNKAGSRTRKVLGTSVFAEGWALYCEELMYDKGFYTDPRIRLAQLKDQIWRCCRVIIDVGLHTQGMTFEQAVDMLVNRAGVERVNAETEVKRYTLTPTQPMSYIIGKHQIMNLRREYEQRRGVRFNLREFHDKLLSYGTIPVAIVSEEMLKGE
jgi:uncharacterized protein (DUF885 family)